MTVVGIALITGGLATLVIFWRVLWGSFRRRDPDLAAEAAATRPGRDAPEPQIGPALQVFADLGSVGREGEPSSGPGATTSPADAEDTSVVVTTPDGRSENAAAQAAGYRYGDRVRDWVRPSYPPTAPAAGDYWLPIDGSLAPEQSPYQGWSPSERPAGYGVAPALQPMPAPAFEPAEMIEAARVPISLGEPVLVPEVPEVPQWPPRATAAGIRPATAEQPEPDVDGTPQVDVSGAREADRGQRHFTRRRRGMTVQRHSGHLDAEPAADPTPRRTPTRGETRRRIIAPQHDLGAAPEATQALPAGEGHAWSGSERVDSVRSREAGQPGRPRPRPRPRSGGAPSAEEREPVGSTVYVSRHAAEPG